MRVQSGVDLGAGLAVVLASNEHFDVVVAIHTGAGVAPAAALLAMRVFLDLTEDLQILAEFLARLREGRAPEATLRILAATDPLLELDEWLLLLLEDLHFWCLVLLTK